MNVANLIKKMELRPGMYVGSLNLDAISYFISGYLYHAIESNQADDVDMNFKNCFHSWVKEHIEEEYSVRFEEQRNYVFYIKQVFRNDEDQIREFFKLCHIFFGEVNKQ